MKKRYLVLADGTVFEGRAFGADRASIGELVFTTGMVGYIATLTDPSYYGQIVMQTFPLIGNYGVIESDFEGDCCLRGYVVREWCDTPSNFRSQYDLDTFLKNKNVPGVWGLDTRAVTKIIREHGVMNAIICDEVPENLDAVKAYAVRGAVEAITVKSPRRYAAQGEKRHTVALIDYGAKHHIVSELQKRGCEVIELPAGTSAGDILALDPDGVMLSNGPGDPAENVECVAQLRALLGRLPMFGICLGHQLLALAAGGETTKLKYGHRGANQPVCETATGQTYITSQNHGYAVVSDSITNGRVSFANANDGTCEGVDYPELRAFSVQFHPEACAGPRDTMFLFDRFVSLMEEDRHAAE